MAPAAGSPRVERPRGHPWRRVPRRPRSPSPTPPRPAAATPKTRVSARGRLRTYFLTGIIVAGPLAITAYITWWFIALIDSFVKPLVPTSYLPDHYLPFSIPGLGLVIAFLAVTLLGFLTANLVGRSVIEFGEVLLARTPVISGLYKGLRQIFETLFSANGTSFRTVGLVEFPVKGTWSVVFLSAPAAPESRARCGPGGPPRTSSSACSCPARPTRPRASSSTCPAPRWWSSPSASTTPPSW